MTIMSSETKIRCPHCGYTGLARLKSSGCLEALLLFVVAVCAFALVHLWIAFVAILVYLLLRSESICCPDCESDLVIPMKR